MKYAIFEIPTEIPTELTKELIKRGMEFTTIGVNDDNDIILKIGYDPQRENEMEGLKAFIYLLKFFKILDAMKKRKAAQAA